MQPNFFIRVNGRYVKVNVHEITYVEGCKNYVRIATGSKIYLALLSMRQVEKALSKTGFCRIHRSYIISLDALTAFDHDHAYVGDRIFPISEQYRQELQVRVNILTHDVRQSKKMVAIALQGKSPVHEDDTLVNKIL